MPSLSYDSLLAKEASAISRSHKLLYFLAGLNATILGYLFTQATLGNLNNLGWPLTVAWWGFGVSLVLSLLMLWSNTYAEAHSIEFFSYYLEECLRFERLLADHANDPKLTNMTTDQKGDFFCKEDTTLKVLVDGRNGARERIQSMQNSIVRKGLYYSLVTATISVYLFSIYFGGQFVHTSNNDITVASTTSACMLNQTIFVQFVSLMLGFVGTVFLAFAFVASESVGTHTDSKGKTTPFVLPDFKRWKFYSGLSLLSVSYLLQIAVLILN